VARGNSSTTLTYKNGTDEIPETVYMFAGDTSYINLFGLRLIAGRNVHPMDSLKEILINGTYCEKLGMDPQGMVDKQIEGNGSKWTVVGILEDFHFKSLHQKVEPIFFAYTPKSTQFSMRLNSKENISATVEEIKRAALEIFPEYDPKPVFVDDTLQKFYEQESRTAKLANTATGLAIFISCLGLFGLASFTAIQRTKEIGVRKVLGASVNNIVALLSREFLILVVIAFLIAVPLSWYAASAWLENFAYRMDVGVWIFLTAGLASVVVAFLTVGYQALKAAIVNPVDSLRYE
jgi:ABC-type antimicrobial peptide transport system permease subunit